MPSLDIRSRKPIHPFHVLAALALVAPFLLLQGCSSLSTTQRQPRTGSEEEMRVVAKGIHGRVLTMDSHDDISADFASDKDDVGSPENARQVSLPKMRKGGLDAEFFAVFTPVGPRIDSAYESAYKSAIARFDAIHRLPMKYPDQIDIAYTADDVVRIHKSGKLVACIGVENGYPIGMDIRRLK